MDNQNISLLANGAKKIAIEEINDNKYCLEYELEINNKKNIKLYCTKTEIILPQSNNYVGKLRLIEKKGEYDYLTISSEGIQNKNSVVDNKNIVDNKIITGNMGLYLLLILVIIMMLMIILYSN
jgi:hypothetical protein